MTIASMTQMLLCGSLALTQNPGSLLIYRLEYPRKVVQWMQTLNCLTAAYQYHLYFTHIQLQSATPRQPFDLIHTWAMLITEVRIQVIKNSLHVMSACNENWNVWFISPPNDYLFCRKLGCCRTVWVRKLVAMAQFTYDVSEENTNCCSLHTIFIWMSLGNVSW